MSFKTAEASVQGFFDTNWKTLGVYKTPISWPDVQFTKPNGTWVRFSMKNNVGRQASMGSPSSNLYRRMGIITIQVFARENGGAVDCRTKADDIVSVFLDNTLAGFYFYDINAKDIGADGFGWYQWNVTIAYRYDIIT